MIQKYFKSFGTHIYKLMQNHNTSNERYDVNFPCILHNVHSHCLFHPLMPNNLYMGCTTLLTSRCCIIYLFNK